MNSERHLHLISFNIPYPPSYGGVIDVYYKIKALTDEGVKVHLHAFHNGIRSHAALEGGICHSVNYYPRKTLLNPFNRSIPLMVQARHSDGLLQNLLKDDYPVFFEGIHCTSLLKHPDLLNRQRIVRMHNIEHIYYKNLAKVEPRLYKKIYLDIESGRLRNYEKILTHATSIAAISPSDHKILNIRYGKSFYLPVFHPNTEVTGQTGRGRYILYHGNLGVSENNEAAMFLVDKIFDDLDLPLVIAGSNPSRQLIKAIRYKKNIIMKTEIPAGEIYHYVRDAQINIMPTFQDTGIKLKLINSLFQGRFCIANTKMIRETGLEDLCIVADRPSDLKNLIREYFTRDFADVEIKKRKEVLTSKFDNRQNINILVDHLYGR